MNDHQNKEIRAAVEYASEHGWRLRKAGPRAHIWGSLLCPEASREGCVIRVFSTPRNPQNHARYIISEVDSCPHVEPE